MVSVVNVNKIDKFKLKIVSANSATIKLILISTFDLYSKFMSSTLQNTFLIELDEIQS